MAIRDEAAVRKDIVSRVSVTRQDVVVAKSYVLKHFKGEPEDLLRAFLHDQHCELPQHVVLNPAVELEPQIELCARSFRWRLALAEAIWGLLGAGMLIPLTANLREWEQHVGWTTVYGNSGGNSSGWRFEEFTVAVPGKLRIAPSVGGAVEQQLTDPDVFISEFGSVALGINVESSVKDAVKCLRLELMLPCLAMLASASEAAWIEVGAALVQYADATVPGDTAVKKLDALLSDPRASISKKMEAILRQYERQDVFGPVVARSGRQPPVVRQVLTWSDVLRDARNALHPDVEPGTRNTYEKSAALLLGAVPNLATLCRVRDAAAAPARTPGV